MKKSILLVVLSCFSFLFVFSQQGRDLAKEKYFEKREGYYYPNVIKINSLAAIFNNISLSYERGISPRFSAGIGVGYKHSGSEPGFFNVDSPTVDFQMDPIQGFTITPEVRWYARKCDNRSMEGFYLGLYVRYARHGTDATFDYYPEDNEPQQFKAGLDAGEYGFGLQLGYQLVLWKRLNIDFMFFGPRFSNYHIGYEFEQNVSPEFLEDMSAYINEVINRFGIEYQIELKQSDEKTANHTFSFANVRFGIGVGFAF